MTAPFPSGPAIGLPQPTETDAGLAEAAAAALAAAAVLPAGGHLTAGTPSRDPRAAVLPGQAVSARFAGAAQGEVVVVVAEDLVAALRDSPLGQLDLTRAVQPALEAAAATFGPNILDPATVLEPAVALDALAAKGDAVYVPLLDGGTIRGAVAVVISSRAAGARRTGPTTAAGGPAGLDLLHHVEMDVTAELGRARMTVRELLALAPGTIVELDRAAGSPADLLVNGRLIARGEVVIIDENFGLRITEILAGDRD
jgi:flagellar motor switch protein FliN